MQATGMKRPRYGFVCVQKLKIVPFVRSHLAHVHAASLLQKDQLLSVQFGDKSIVCTQLSLSELNVLLDGGVDGTKADFTVRRTAQQPAGSATAKHERLGLRDAMSVAAGVQSNAGKMDPPAPKIDSDVYTAAITRHPEHGLGLTLEGKPAVISGLISCPDGSPGAAERVGVVVGSTVLSVGGFDTMAFGAA